MISMVERGSTADREPHFASPKDKCPYSPTFVIGQHASPFGFPEAHSTFVGLMSQPAVFAQAESMRRISRDRARQKRGPPAIL